MLASGASQRAVARRFNYTQPVMNKHANEHTGLKLFEHNLIEPTLVRIKQLNQRTLVILARAEDERDPQIALQAIRESRHNLELIAKLTGELKNPEASEPTRVEIVIVDKPIQ
jgi:hypothetical protein